MSTRSSISCYSVASQVHIAELKKKREDDKKRADLALEALKEKENALHSKEEELVNLRRMLAMKNNSPQAGPSGIQNIPNRKRHNSNQLGGASKDSRVEQLANHIPVDIIQKPSETERVPVSSVRQADIPHVEAVFNITNDKAMRQELEVNIETLNGTAFHGTITQLEAKHIVYKESLKLDLNNFDGVRFGYKSCPVMIFKLKEAINVDELLPIQNFEFNRKTSRQGRTHVDVIGCKIRGLRAKVNESDAPRFDPPQDDGTRMIKIEGCEYRVPEKALVEFLEFFGELRSEIVEDTFVDGLSPPGTENCGTNRTGTYSVNIKLYRKIPQLLPIMGKRVRIYYPGIQKLCPNCYGPHPKRTCHSKRIQWKNYVRKFMDDFKEIPSSLYGRWLQSDVVEQVKVMKSNHERIQEIGQGMNPRPSPPDQLIPAKEATLDWVRDLDGIDSGDVTLESSHMTDTQAASTQLSSEGQVDGPKKEDFNVPNNRAEHELFISRLVHSGLTVAEAGQVLTSRKAAYNKACREFKKDSLKGVKRQTKKPIRSSKNAFTSAQSNAD